MCIIFRWIKFHGLKEIFLTLYNVRIFVDLIRVSFLSGGCTRFCFNFTVKEFKRRTWWRKWRINSDSMTGTILQCTLDFHIFTKNKQTNVHGMCVHEWFRAYTQWIIDGNLSSTVILTVVWYYLKYHTVFLMHWIFKLNCLISVRVWFCSHRRLINRRITMSI